MQDEPTNRRRQKRTRSNDTMFWKRPEDESYQLALTLETSKDGMAFAWRGDDAPKTGTVIHIQLSPSKLNDKPKHAVVRRVNHAHEDLVIIAVERLSNRSARSATAKAEIPAPVISVNKATLAKRVLGRHAA